MSKANAEAIIASLKDDENVTKDVSSTTEGKIEYAYKEADPEMIATDPFPQGLFVKYKHAENQYSHFSGKEFFLPATDKTPVPGRTYFVRYVKPVDAEDTHKKGTGTRKGITARKNRELLLTKALDWISHNYKPDSFTIKVTAVDIHLLDPTVDAVHLGDIGKVIYDKANSEKRGTCYAITYHLADPEKMSTQLVIRKWHSIINEEWYQ